MKLLYEFDGDEETINDTVRFLNRVFGSRLTVLEVVHTKQAGTEPMLPGLKLDKKPEKYWLPKVRDDVAKWFADCNPTMKNAIAFLWVLVDDVERHPEAATVFSSRDMKAALGVDIMTNRVRGLVGLVDDINTATEISVINEASGHDRYDLVKELVIKNDKGGTYEAVPLCKAFLSAMFPGCSTDILRPVVIDYVAKCAKETAEEAKRAGGVGKAEPPKAEPAKEEGPPKKKKELTVGDYENDPIWAVWAKTASLERMAERNDMKAIESSGLLEVAKNMWHKLNDRQRGKIRAMTAEYGTYMKFSEWVQYRLRNG